jgi:KaiC/GvpD/RAD55 family RecA-like ATPase
MEQSFNEKLTPSRCMWCVLNNLPKFDEKPDFILNLVKKWKNLKDHDTLSSYLDLFLAVENFYNENQKFPDSAWLKIVFKDNRPIQIVNDEYSSIIYETLDKYLDQEILKENLNKYIVRKDIPSILDIRVLAKEMLKYSDSNVEIPKETRKSLTEAYELYEQNFQGIQTYIPALDETIGVMGYQSLSVLAAPSGHGKSTCALSIAYYNAIAGKVVDYLSFEVPKNHMYFNIASIESEGHKGEEIPASDIKERALDERGKELYKKYINDFMDKCSASGGYLNIIDQTTASINTFESLCNTLESIAEKRGRAADLIVVDNIDNFQTLRSSERDEATKINNYIVSLDAFSKTYCNGTGTSMLLLSQVNRPAMKRLGTPDKGNAKDTSVKIDVTCVQKYNALYEKATCVLVAFSDAATRARNIMRIYPVKLRNRPLPTRPVEVQVNFKYSKVIGDFPDKTFSQEQVVEVMDNTLYPAMNGTGEAIDGMDDFEDDL